MRNDRITLITKVVTGASVSEQLTVVFAEKKSVKRAEFYAAYEVGLNARAMFEMDPLDWESAFVDGAEPTEIEYNSRRLNIIRSFESFDRVEVTCG